MEIIDNNTILFFANKGCFVFPLNFVLIQHGLAISTVKCLNCVRTRYTQATMDRTLDRYRGPMDALAMKLTGLEKIRIDRWIYATV